MKEGAEEEERGEDDDGRDQPFRFPGINWLFQKRLDQVVRKVSYLTYSTVHIGA